MTNILEKLGASLIQLIEDIGKITLFLGQTLFWLFRRPFRPELFAEQLYLIGNRSIFIVFLTAAFSGMVFAVQFYFGFRTLKADSLVGPVSALTFSRELGPVFTAIVVTGRSGAAMAAELGTMRVTEQIDAMDVMAVNSIQYLVVPRVTMGIVALPILTTLFIFVANLGSFFVGVFLLGIDRTMYFAHLESFVQMVDLYQGLLKSTVYGLMFATIGTYKGYTTTGGAAGVGRATNTAVVVTLVMVLISDYFLTLIVRYFLYR